MTAEPVQQVMPGFETPSDDILDLLKRPHIRYVDKSGSGGSLWILGGHELDSLVAEARDRAKRLLNAIEKATGRTISGKDSDEVIQQFGASLI